MHRCQNQYNRFVEHAALPQTEEPKAAHTQ